MINSPTLSINRVNLMHFYRRRMGSERIVWIDNLKGFAIFLVTLGHVLIGLGAGDSVPKNVIYAFHMPLFFGISGYLATCLLLVKRGDLIMSISAALRFCVRKIHTLLLPYVLCPLLLWPLFYGYLFNDGYFLHTAQRIFIDNSALWFLPCLWILMAAMSVVSVVHGYMQRIPVWVLLGVVQMVLVAAFGLTHNPFLRSAVSYFLPFSVGMYLAYNENLVTLCRKPFVMVILMGVFLASCVGFVILAFDQGQTLCKAFRMICGISSIPLMIVFFQALKSSVLTSAVMAPVGRNTLIIYMFNTPLLSYDKINLDYGFWAFPVAIGVTSMIIVQGMLIKWLMRKSRILSFLFLGRSN